MKRLIFLTILISNTQLFAQNFTNPQDPYFVMLSRRAEILGLTPPALTITKPTIDPVAPNTPVVPTPTNDDEDGFAPFGLKALTTELDTFLEQLNVLTQELSTLSKQRNTP